MKEEIVVFAGLVVVFAVILGFEWRLRLKTLRIGGAVLAVTVWVLAQPNYHVAWRRAMSTPPADRITHFPDGSPDSEGRPLSEFESGVFAMRRSVVENAAGYARERQLGVAVLFWLAIAPALRRPEVAGTRTVRRNSEISAPEA